MHVFAASSRSVFVICPRPLRASLVTAGFEASGETPKGARAIWGSQTRRKPDG